MHELALCQSVVDSLREQSRIHGFERVSTVRLAIGAFSCVSADAIEFCFSAVCRGSLAEGARLEVIRLAGEACCLDCGGSTTIQDRQDACAHCGSHRLRVTQGDEMLIQELEVV